MTTTGAATEGAAAIGQAIKASGALIHLESSEFLKILSKIENPLVVTVSGGVFLKNQYLTNYNGLHIYCKSNTVLNLDADVEVVQAKKIWVPIVTGL